MFLEVLNKSNRYHVCFQDKDKGETSYIVLFVESIIGIARNNFNTK